MIKYTHIIWDWNGTLLNDVSASLASVNDMLCARGMETIDINRYKECISVPISGFYEKVFDLSKEDYSEILRQYNEGYLRHLSVCTLTYGAVEMIEFFASEGAKQAIVSSSNNAQLTENCKKYGIYEKFDAVLGAEGYKAESKIGRAVDYLNKSGAEKGKVLVIGDLVHDAELAREIGADCVLLTSGHEHPERLFQSGATVTDSLFSLKKSLLVDEKTEKNAAKSLENVDDNSPSKR